MKHNEKQILEKSKKILKDLEGQFFKEENIENAWFDKDNTERGNETKVSPCWIVSINEPVFDTSKFLTISDETGEPLYIQNKHGVVEIEKDKDGKYKGKNNDNKRASI